MKPFKPDGYPSVSPYLIVDDVDAAIAFLTAALGATEIRRMVDDEKRVRHAEVRLDDGIIMLGGAMAGWPPQPSHMHVYVADVDAAFARALAAGGTSVMGPEQRGDPDKRGGVKDSTGTTWWISTMVG